MIEEPVRGREGRENPSRLLSSKGATEVWSHKIAMMGKSESFVDSESDRIVGKRLYVVIWFESCDEETGSIAMQRVGEGEGS